MARVLSGGNNIDKLADLCSKPYKEQAVWFLNAFWLKFAAQEAEKIWAYTHKCNDLDLDKKAAGCALDELNAHRFLEHFHETMTVHAMREKLRSTGAIGDRIRLVPISHILLFKYQMDWNVLVNAAQGNAEEVEKAQRMLEQVQLALGEAIEKEEEARAAQRELEPATRELRAQEDAFNNRTEELRRATTTGGLVSQNKAKNELSQHLASDPLPLRRARITQEAAVKKAERATMAAQVAREAAERAVAEAEAYLEEAKSRGVPDGAIWWLERELHEAKAYMPTAKGGYKKEK